MIDPSNFVTKRRLYWTCQLAGWIVFVSYSVWTFSFFSNFTEKLIINSVVNICLGILVTDSYRNYIVRHRWLKLPMKYLIPRVLFGVFCMSTIFASINMPLDKWMFPDAGIQFTLNQLFYAITNWSKYVLIWTLLYHIFQYYERFLTIEKDKIQLEALMKGSQLANLRNQINPHFLFNSLNSIRALVDHEPQNAKRAITKLSNLLRRSLSAERETAQSLAAELDTVEDYIEIEKIRFEDRLNYKSEIATETLQFNVPPMLLQTLVENAVKHGISTRKNGGTITLRSYIAEPFHMLSIENPGELNVSHPSGASSLGLGIQNSIERLKIIFGSKASLTLFNTQEGTVLTQIKIPLSSNESIDRR